ncbi:MAG: hypothetical protein KDA85_09715, partial [Planctomycetaceae bacterium]|nr:hypothetical protein [Planctomycetaceae bacterium]
VVHRDLKPGNVIVGRYGEVYVMDWGLAKTSESATEEPDSGAAAAESTGPLLSGRTSHQTTTHQTIYGAAVGTPFYMSPEQAAGKHDQLDSRTDVYAIGAILYELLANRRPYGGKAGQTGFDVIELVLAGPPQPIREVNRKASRELAAIAHKAMQRKKEDRYQSAMDVAGDLRAFISQRVVSAYRTGIITRLNRWIARNQSVTIAGTLTLLSIIGALVVVMVMQQSNRDAILKKIEELVDLVAQKDEANSQAAVAQRNARGLSFVRHSQQQREMGDVELASLLALEAENLQPGSQATESLYAAAAELVPGVELKGATDTATDLVWNADGSRIVTIHFDGLGYIWDPQRSQPLAQLVNRQRCRFTAAVFSDDGQSIVTVGGDGTLAVWDAETGIRLRSIDVGAPLTQEPDDYDRPDLLDVACCLNDHTVVLMTSHQKIHMFDLNTGREIAVLDPRQADVEGQAAEDRSLTVMQVSPDRRTLVTGCTDGQLLIWNLQEQKLASAVQGNQQPVHSISFSPDGTQFVTCSGGGEEWSRTDSGPAELWSVASGERVRQVL